MKDVDGVKGGEHRAETTTDLHALYEAAVQNVEADLEFVERIFKREIGSEPRLLREDFCGTASLAARFAASHAENRAWGVDLDRSTLEWGRKHRVEILGEAASRVELICGDVRTPAVVPVDVVTAFNFSYWNFRTRAELGRYFEASYASLRDEGMLFLDLFGGTESACEVEEESEFEESIDPDGRRIPSFKYTWDQVSFNPIDHGIVCHIHFRLGKGKKGKKRVYRRAFTYEWRFWTLPEIRELLEEAGFQRSTVYVEGWDDEADEPDGIFRLKKTFDNEGGWIAYVAAVKTLKE